MRPICLRMSAFGPFAGVEEINFTELGENPLFLINGPTGSGKSTILDAICFALYGETTGNEREARQMRCDHSDPATLTEVSLTFELPGGRYRITRIPDQFRPKARGDGFTEQKARAELYKLEKDNTEKLIVAPKVTEANEAIVDLTGLSAEQFRQVMVLPQGKFRDLLLAKSEERELIFQQLFQTHVYSTLQAKLREKAGDLSNKIKETVLQQAALLKAHDLDTVEELQSELETLKERLKNLEQQKQQASDKLKQAQVAVQQAKVLDKDFSDHILAKNKFSELVAKQAEISQQKHLLDLAKKYQEIEPLFLQTKKQNEFLIAAQQKVEICQKILNTSSKDLAVLEVERQKLPEIEKSLEKINASVIELEAYRSRSAQLELSQKKLSDAEKYYIAAQKSVVEKQNTLDSIKQALEKSEAKFQEDNRTVAILPEKKSHLEKLTEQGNSIRKITDLQTELEKLNDLILALKKTMEEAEKSYQQKNRNKEIYEQAWQVGQAAIIASQLNENEPCPVCGSIEHPSLACSQEKLPTEQELNQVREDAEQARVVLEKTTREVLLKQEESKNILNNMNEEKSKNLNSSEMSLDLIRQYYQQNNDEIKSLQKIVDALPALQKQTEDHKKTIKILEAELGQNRQQESEAHSLLATAKADVETKKAELPDKFRDAKVLEETIAAITVERNQLKANIDKLVHQYQQAREAKISSEAALTSARENTIKLEIQYKESLEIWRASLEKSVFTDEHDFQQAKMDKADEEQLSKAVRDYEDEKLIAEKQLEEKTAAIAEKVRPELHKLTEIENQSALEKNDIETEFHKIQQRQQVLKSSYEKLKKSVTIQRKLEEEYGVIGKLSDISNGKNPHNLSLQRFVLSVLLDDVLTEASSRLHKMSKGRYQLYRKESVGDKRLKSGLELEVEDAYTGKQRPAATLSGGESFMAALALALGLSDVVQAYAGGIKLDTLFIDEGFGSLDPESLDLAIHTLLDLRASGRMVGVISHVEEMKRIINVRLDVIANREVSTTRLVSI